MSVSKWSYEPEKCDGDFCIGDCDFCPKQMPLLDEEDARTEERLFRYAWFFGDLVPKFRREQIARDPNSIGACTVDQYINMAVEKPKPRKPQGFDGKPLGKRATKKLLRQLREEFTNGE